jgi:hypothetical protein
MTMAEDKVISQLKKVAEEMPETKQPTVHFMRDWAYGNAGIENESITRSQVQLVITETKPE